MGGELNGSDGATPGKPGLQRRSDEGEAADRVPWVGAIDFAKVVLDALVAAAQDDESARVPYGMVVNAEERSRAARIFGVVFSGIPVAKRLVEMESVPCVRDKTKFVLMFSRKEIEPLNATGEGA